MYQISKIYFVTIFILLEKRGRGRTISNRLKLGQTEGVESGLTIGFGWSKINQPFDISDVPYFVNHRS